MAREVKKSRPSIRKFHPFTLTAFAYYLASGSWPFASKTALPRNDKDKKSACWKIAALRLNRGVSTCFATYQVLSYTAHWIRNKSALSESYKLIAAPGI